MFSQPGIYVVQITSLPEYKSPILSAPLTGKNYGFGYRLNVTKVQQNVLNVMEWGQLANGNWVPLVQNGRLRVKFEASVVTPPPPPVETPVPVEVVEPLHVSKFGPTTITVDGIPFEYATALVTYPDGTFYVEQPGVTYGRVGFLPDDFLLGPEATLEVCYIPVNDITPPREGKGSTIPFSKAWFSFLDNFHNNAAKIWLWTPGMLWCNRRFIGDMLGSTTADGADPEPVLESITSSGNVMKVLSKGDTHYEVWSLPTNRRPEEFDPFRFNWLHFPWVFFKAQARTRTNQIANVGAGLDVWHMNVRKPQNTQWISKSLLTLLPELPALVTDKISIFEIVGYQMVGSSTYGITRDFKRIPLHLVEKPGQSIYPTNWRGPATVAIPASAESRALISRG